MGFRADDIVFFFGAGASAPFGIPTMKQFVIDFEKLLDEKGTKEEKQLYNSIKDALAGHLKREIDLEDVFSVIDGYINFNYERLGVLSTYVFDEDISRRYEKLGAFPSSTYEKNVPICQNLREKFQIFVREKCLIPDESFKKISKVYQDFFNRFVHESDVKGTGITFSRGNYSCCPTWTIFTTNYDTCLEHYWRQAAKIDLNTGFSFDSARYRPVLKDSERFYQNDFKLIKLHGSVSWFIESDGTIVEEQTVPTKSFVGREIVEEMMIYPVQQKELYLEPYISMLVQLNQQLAFRSIWIVIGYSFNDPVIREIFLRKSDDRKQIILVHPHAPDIMNSKLNNIKSERIHLLNQKFGEDLDFKTVNDSIINCIARRPAPFV
jgi:hypothetical protein